MANQTYDNFVIEYFSNFVNNAFRILSLGNVSTKQDEKKMRMIIDNIIININEQQTFENERVSFNQLYEYIKNNDKKDQSFYSVLFDVIRYQFTKHNLTFEFPHKINLNINKPIEGERHDQSRSDLPDIRDINVLKYRNENLFKDIVISIINNKIKPILDEYIDQSRYPPICNSDPAPEANLK